MAISYKTLKPGELAPEIGIITGTRPGVIMMAPVVHELLRRDFPFFVIHSSQHYSPNMDAQIFTDLQLPDPDYRLEGVHEYKTHGAQTGVMLKGIEDILLARKPAIMLVYGDTNSNLAAALAARKLHIAIAHVEAGERCHEWGRPEEHNRKMIDCISDYLLATGEKAVRNLTHEGIPESRIVVTGNPIVDASIENIERAKKSSHCLEELQVESGNYGIATIHREENCNDKDKLIQAFEGISKAAEELDIPRVVFLSHPGTKKRLEEFGLDNWVKDLPRLAVTDAVGYLDFINLLAHARLAFTDSGGVAQETLIHRVPCVVLVDKTEWVEAVELGAHIIAGCNKSKIIQAAKRLDGLRGTDWGWPFGTPDSSAKIVDALINHINKAVS